MKAKPVTINDVARLAEVSIKTVSRVLNEEPNVRADTSEKVKWAVEQLNYQPSLSARSLAGNRSRLIGLLYENPSADYIKRLQEGALLPCRNAGYHLIAEPTGDEIDVILQRVSLLQRQLRIDGVILTPPLCDNGQVISLLRRHDTPFVQIAPEAHRDGACVFIDDFKATYNMTTCLLDLGHRRIGFIKGHPEHSVSQERFQGFRKALKDRKLTLPRPLVRQGYFSYRSGMQCAERLLQLQPRPSAIFASNDDMAAGVMAMAYKMGIPVPEALSVTGFDDAPIAQVIWPQLSTVRQPVKDMAAIAAELLIEQLRARENGKHLNAQATQRYLDFELVWRDSTAPLSSP